MCMFSEWGLTAFNRTYIEIKIEADIDRTRFTNELLIASRTTKLAHLNSRN